MTPRDLAGSLRGGSLILQEAPLRVGLSAAFFFAIPALCLAFPGLLEAQHRLALLVVLAGGGSVLLLHLSRRHRGHQIRPGTPGLGGSTSLSRKQQSLPLPPHFEGLGAGNQGLMPVVLSVTPPPRERFRFILRDLAECLPEQDRKLAYQIRVSWARCFEDHAASVEEVRSLCSEIPYCVLVWEDHPLIGSLFEETFEDLGLLVRRFLVSEPSRRWQAKQIPNQLRWVQQEEYILGAIPALKEIAEPSRRVLQCLPMRTVGQTPRALAMLVPPLAPPLKGDFAEAFGHLISQVLLAATRLKKLPKPV